MIINMKIVQHSQARGGMADSALFSELQFCHRYVVPRREERNVAEAEISFKTIFFST